MQGRYKVNSAEQLPDPPDNPTLRRLATAEQEAELHANPGWREQNTKAISGIAIFVVAGTGVAFGMPQWLGGLICLGAFVWLAR